MNLVFTDYVRSRSAGEPPDHDHDLFREVQDKLRSFLISEMRKRGLWDAPPSYLGVHGAGSWSEPDALDELLSDCFLFILHRLPSLEAQLKVRDNIEGMLARNVRNYLYDNQKKHDRLGFRVFMVGQTAIRQLITDGTLHVLEGEPRVDNGTVLGFAAGDDPAKAHRTELGPHVEVWNHDLLPDLVTARGTHDIAERLSSHVLRLRDCGVDHFRFKDLVDALKSDARERWNAIWMQQEGETAYEEDGEEGFPVLVRLIRPDSGVEDREVFGKLVACVAEALDRHDTAVQTRSYLERLWDFLRSHAAESEDETTVSGAMSSKSLQLPSRRKIASALRIPRERISGLLETLGGLVKNCQSALSGI